MILIRLRVTGLARPLRATDLRFTYRNGFRAHTQTMHVSYVVTGG
ncbi:hypothetical protein ACXJJ3_27435 [Kribbella sp. WER1]